jgi:hypothetical protein
MFKGLVSAALLTLTGALICAANSPASAEIVINNVLSPFSSVKITGSRPGPRPPYSWAPECNQGFSEWRPVCAVNRNRLVLTYPNRCMAELDAAVVLFPDECPRRVSCSFTYEPVCARINRAGGPVPLEEALRPPVLRPFINECFTRTLPDRVRGEAPPPEATEELSREITILRRYGDEIYHSGYPGGRYRYYGRSGIEDFAEVCPRSCPEGGLLVCALDHNNVFRLFKNRCSAILAGANPHILRPGDLSKCR